MSVIEVSKAVKWLEAAFGGSAKRGAERDAREALARAQAALDESTRHTHQAVARDHAGRSQAVFDAVYLVASADGVITKEERGLIGRRVSTLVGAPVEDEALDDHFEMSRVLVDEKGLDGAAAEIAAKVPQGEPRHALLLVASIVGWADGGLASSEVLALQALAKSLGLSPAEVEAILAEAAKAQTT
jgi:tellurite resistance protein